MKPVLPIDEEYLFDSGVIISETDLNGIITFANRKFCEMSGYEREELLGSPHSIIRHPDMPKAAFRHLWETIKAGDEWSGIVKNLRKDGRYYWVETHVKPIIKNGTAVGYIAARKPVAPLAAKEAEERYRHLKSEEDSEETRG